MKLTIFQESVRNYTLILIASLLLIPAVFATRTSAQEIKKDDTVSRILKEASDTTKSTVERTKILVGWITNNFDWSATDYQKRTVSEIIERRSGNCADLAGVLSYLLKTSGIKSRWIAEINIQPKSETRQANAEEKILQRGNSYSVFGLMHNDHRWLEVYDEAAKAWFPADPSSGIVGYDEWIAMRLGFGKRPTPPIHATADIVNSMLVPFVVLHLSQSKGGEAEDLSNHYLIEEFNKHYNGKLSALPSWPEWVRLIEILAPVSLQAFEGKVNLHNSSGLIEKLFSIYNQLNNEAIKSGILVHDGNSSKMNSTEVFDWIVSKVKTNYPGMSDKVHDKESFSAFTDSIRSLINGNNKKEDCLKLYKAFLGYFRDFHLTITPRSKNKKVSVSQDTLLNRFLSRKLDNNTHFLSIPNFNIKYKKVIDSLIQSSEKSILESKYLIIDIRNNPGGSDVSFSKILPIIYTDPIVRVGSDVWSTEDNITKYESLANDERYSREIREEMRKMVLKLKEHPCQFVSREEDDTLRFSEKNPFPQKVYILINNKVASSAEGFLLEASQSKKVTLVGQPTKGELDYANVNYMETPGGEFELGCPTTRSRRLPEKPVDGCGIKPDIALPENSDLIKFVLEHLR